MKFLIVVTIISLIVSFIMDKNKTIAGMKKGLYLFANILPAIISIMIIVSIVLHFTPKETLIRYLGSNSGFAGYMVAAFVGSISLIPGIVAYPLAGMLIKNGVSYSIIAVFITTLTMVGIITIPMEARYFGFKTAIIRNILSFCGAIIIGIVISFLWKL
ncbi:MAG TPA: permease [Spirochaetota bacterium]|nr:permease [Spirochaetota bacterium]HQJ72968.1 permease [Spirochaetota bacterium]HRS79416.1 permease [Spirochaetota bacterium]